ncbi:MAG TPA: hypothetical protein VMU77_02590 [Acidimicrobiales bacterium]|nr:hypothetical protein [Acidimicrobiales bacterium]
MADVFFATDGWLVAVRVQVPVPDGRLAVCDVDAPQWLSLVEVEKTIGRKELS